MLHDTIFLTGYSHLPEVVPTLALSRSVGIYLEVEPVSGKVVEVEASLHNDGANVLMCEVLLGACLVLDRERLRRAVRARFWGGARGAVSEALENVFRNFDEICEPRFDDIPGVCRTRGLSAEEIAEAYVI